MQETSALYKELLESSHNKETRLSIGGIGVLVTEKAEKITFGGQSILVGKTDADGGFGEGILETMETNGRVFSGDVPAVGDCVSGEIDVQMYKPVAEIPKRARLIPYVRLTDGTRFSEWVQKGVFYIDTRRKKEDGSPDEKIIIHGYDDMLKAEQDYPSSVLDWPAKDIDVVREIAAFMGVSLDKRTTAIMTHGYQVQYTTGYSCREVLGYIASMYAGCFVMSDIGELRLIGLTDLPEETSYLVENNGYAITFGGVHILV